MQRDWLHKFLWCCVFFFKFFFVFHELDGHLKVMRSQQVARETWTRMLTMPRVNICSMHEYTTQIKHETISISAVPDSHPTPHLSPFVSSWRLPTFVTFIYKVMPPETVPNPKQVGGIAYT